MFLFFLNPSEEGKQGKKQHQKQEAAGPNGPDSGRVIPTHLLRVITVVEDVGEAVQDAVTTATVGASFLNPLAVRNQTAAPDALVVLAAPPGEERRAGTEAAQDTGSSVLTAAPTLLSTACEADEGQDGAGVAVFTVPAVW